METAETSRLFRMWPWLGVLLVLLLAGFVRFRLLDMPLERDEGEYAYAGQLLLQGIPPYKLAWNMKLPGTYFIYALGMAAFGQTCAGVHSTLLIANALTIVFVFLLARKLFGPVAGLAACATFGILSASPAVLGMAAHANHFVILFAVPATILLWQAEESRLDGVLFMSGLLYGLVFLMKQQGICFCLFAIAVLLGNAIQNRTIARAALARRIFFFCIAMLLPFGLTCLYLYRAGVFAKFWFWTFTYAASYAAELNLHEGAVKFAGYVHKKWPIYIGFVAFAAVALPCIVRTRSLRKRIIFAAAFLIFSFFGASLDLNFREHYFLLILPAFAVFIGLAVLALQNASVQPAWKILPPLVCAFILVCSLFQQWQFFFQLPANAVSAIVYYGDTPFTAMPGVGSWIRTHSATNATIAVIGSEPEIYFYAHRHSATGFIYTYALMEPQPYASQMQRDMIHEIESNRPEFLVFVPEADSWNVRPSSDRTIFKWFDQYSLNYMSVAATGMGSGVNGTIQSLPITIYQRKPADR